MSLQALCLKSSIWEFLLSRWQKPRGSLIKFRRSQNTSISSRSSKPQLHERQKNMWGNESVWAAPQKSFSISEGIPYMFFFNVFPIRDPVLTALENLMPMKNLLMKRRKNWRWPKITSVSLLLTSDYKYCPHCPMITNLALRSVKTLAW